ncbi:hypothetical protein HGRIS_004954 [Hohenbuehelia grisea]|uniref:Protein kinase domain-containing protein n=1 Tax=Hohenbuehelia grisea TaxID=104357 RepID=A0ABR3JDQ9_9AGAR
MLVAIRVYAHRFPDFHAAARKLLEAAFPRWSMVDHPNLAPFLGIVDKGFLQPSVVTSYYTKGTLWRHLLRQPKMTLSQDQIAERLFWCLEIARAIEYLHGLDPPIIHSDIRCANVFMEDAGHIRVAEYGILMTMPADVLDHVWAPRPAGHAHYRWMAPELFGNNRPPGEFDPPMGYSMATDVWAFGMTVLEVCSGPSSIFIFSVYPRADIHCQVTLRAGSYGQNWYSSASRWRYTGL